MQNMRTLAAKFLATAAVVFGFGTSSAWAGIPVIDATNVAQSTISAVQEVAAVEKQIQQYTTQLSQYENQLKNTVAPAEYIWNQASSIITKLNSSVTTLNKLTSTYGTLSAYLSKFSNSTTYASNACFTSTGCSKTSITSVLNSRTIGSSTQKDANDAALTALQAQQTQLSTDATTLDTLKTNAQSATGRLEAIQYANQLAAAQTDQTMQLRAAFIAMQTAQAARNQAVEDREAQEQAAATQWHGGGTYSASTGTGY